jgi:hypothetical protein
MTQIQVPEDHVRVILKRNTDLERECAALRAELEKLKQLLGSPTTKAVAAGDLTSAFDKALRSAPRGRDWLADAAAGR